MPEAGSEEQPAPTGDPETDGDADAVALSLASALGVSLVMSVAVSLAATGAAELPPPWLPHAADIESAAVRAARASRRVFMIVFP
ncbi:hypothetical protein Misp03_60940 [Microbispora sp. NBRC 16548]|nr:hypothetical protein Misp03_60940 [Microbispora sp. NBRC 16548]